MASNILPIRYSEAGANGAASGVAIPVSGIKSGDVLLAVIKWAAATDPAPVATSDFTVADGTITAGTLTTASKLLWVMWVTPHV